MRIKDQLLACCIVLIWGINFVVIKVGVAHIPPLLLGALRFSLVAFPAIFFVPAPKASWRLVMAYGLTISFLQFAFLFCAIAVGMPAGLASLVLQTQAFFTLVFCAVTFGDALKLHHLGGILVAFSGIGLLVLGRMAQDNQLHFSLAGLGLTLLAAISWSTGNVFNKKIAALQRNDSALSLVVWGGTIPIIPFFLASYWLEGPQQMLQGFHQLGWVSLLCLGYLAYAATMLGYSMWNSLLSRYETWRVAPLTLMVPLVGLLASYLLLGETLSWLQVGGALLVMSGLIITLFGPRLLRAGINRVRQRQPDS